MPEEKKKNTTKIIIIVVAVVIGLLLLSSVLRLAGFDGSTDKEEDDTNNPIGDDDDDDDDNTEKEPDVRITFGEPEYAAKSADNYHMWVVDVFPSEKIYEVNVTPITKDCYTKYIGSNIISLAHPAVDNQYIYIIEFTIHYKRNENHSVDYLLKCEI